MPTLSYNRFPKIIVQLDPTVDAALRVAAEQVAQAAKARVPVASGDLRNSIHVERQGGGYAVIAGDDTAFYGHMVEFGTSRTSPRPFLVPALEEQRGELEAYVRGALRSL